MTTGGWAFGTPEGGWRVRGLDQGRLPSAWKDGAREVDEAPAVSPEEPLIPVVIGDRADARAEGRFDIAIQDQVARTVSCQRIVISEGSTRTCPHFMRRAWPSELDLMARLAGLERRERWARWDRAPFTSASKSHVSVYALA